MRHLRPEVIPSPGQAGKRDLHQCRRPLNHFALDRHHAAWRAPTERAKGEGAFRARPRLSEFKDSPAAVRLGRSFSVGILVHCAMMGQGFHPASQYITQRLVVGPGDEAAMVAIAQPERGNRPRSR